MRLQTDFSRRAMALALFSGVELVFPSTSFAACQHDGQSVFPMVSTLAGIGTPGNTDGTALKAQFIEPSAISRAVDGSVYIADAGAQNIRRLFHGQVTTLAGYAIMGRSDEQRTGGYRDGPAGTAEFNRPVGIAVGKDGAVYVADSLNHAIRIIRNGMVSTLTRDLVNPRAIAIADDGTIYIADYGSGVRIIDKTGGVSPMDTISDASDRNICGLSTKGNVLAYTDSKSVNLVDGSSKRKAEYDAPVDPVFEGQRLGPACGVQILGPDSVVVSNLYDNSIRYVRFRIDGIVAAPITVRMLVRGKDDARQLVGGFADGPSSEAIADVPRGLALEPNGDVLFADAGNRRIRVIHGIDARGPVGINQVDQSLNVPTLSKSSYRVAVVGNSFAFTNAMWMDSIPGRIEQGLIKSSAPFGSHRCPDVAGYRLSNASLGDLADFTSTYYGDGEADLVILLLDNYNFEKDATVFASASGQSPDSTRATETNSTFLAHLVARVNEIDERLKKNHTALGVAFIPDGRSITTLENNEGDTLPLTLQDLYSDFKPGFLTFSMDRVVEEAFSKTSAHILPISKYLEAAERSSNRTPLFEPLDPHPSPAGTMLIGNTIANDLEMWKPWLSVK